MKVLFISILYPPTASAIGNIIEGLQKEFEFNNVQIDGLTDAQSLSNSFVEKRDNGNVFYAKYLSPYAKKYNTLKDKLTIVCRKIKYKLFGYKTLVINKQRVNAYIRALKKIDLSKYNAIVCCCAFYDCIECCMQLKKQGYKLPKIVLYQVDPLAENKAYYKFSTNYLEEYEKNLYKNCDYIVTTPIIYNLKKNKNYNLSNVIPLEFPLIKAIDKSNKIEKNDNEIKCVFSGGLFENIRNPKYTFELFSKLKNKNIKLYLIGSGCEWIVDEYKNNQLKDVLLPVGLLDYNSCQSWIDSADILVNIGNSVDNQVPSKLFEYINHGKPILNICKINNCPTLNYLNKYPYSLSIFENEDVEKNAKLVEKFITSNVNKNISSDAIFDIYKECTTKYIANKFLEIIKK